MREHTYILHVDLVQLLLDTCVGYERMAASKRGSWEDRNTEIARGRCSAAAAVVFCLRVQLYRIFGVLSIVPLAVGVHVATVIDLHVRVD